jgi:hypothetical protein
MGLKNSEEDDRRQFLQTCGRFAVVTSPAVTLLLSTSLTSTAIASSGGRNVRNDTGDRGTSWFDDDRASSQGSSQSSGASSGGSSVPGGASSGRQSIARSGGASGGSPSGGASSTTIASSRKTVASGGGGGCLDEEDEKLRDDFDCKQVKLRDSSTGSEH